MPARRRGGGGGGPVKTVAGWLFAAMVGVAVLKGLPSDPKALYHDLSGRSDRLSTRFNQEVGKVVVKGPDGKTTVQLPRNPVGKPGSGTAGKPAGKPVSKPAAPAEGEPAGTSGGKPVGTASGGKQPAQGAPKPAAPPAGKPAAGGGTVGAQALAGVKVAPKQTVAYDRGQWRHWDNLTACWTVREQVLYRDAVPGSVTLLDRSGHRTSNVKTACEVAGGKWLDPYTKTVFTNPDDLDIDHVVPLGNAAASGGQGWSSSRKQDYANYLAYSHHLLAVSASANRAKGDKGPEAWRPSNRADWCTYATDWARIKQHWQLTVTSGEKKALEQMLGTCS